MPIRCASQRISAPHPPARAAVALCCLIAVLAGGPAAGMAQAKRVIAPPGNSGVEQYLEVVPGAEGNVPVGSVHPKKGVLPKATSRRLEALGAEGKAAAAFAESTGVAAGRHRRGHGGKAKHGERSRHRGSGAASGEQPPSSGLGLPARATTVAAAGGGGIGLGLPLALALIAFVAIAVAVLSRRRSRS